MVAQDSPASYKVVINDEEQYSIWTADAQNPPGWCDAGISGTRQECLDYIAKVWTDMRPLSLRRRMAQSELAQGHASVQPPMTAPTASDDLLARLSIEKQAVQLIRSRTIREDLDAGYVHLQFLRAVGGTELGIRLDPSSCDYSCADLDAEVGTIRIGGSLVLNSDEVRCAAEIELTTLAGIAILERQPA
jgi:uncharacterized protein YbdZ (MbtH family)